MQESDSNYSSIQCATDYLLNRNESITDVDIVQLDKLIQQEAISWSTAVIARYIGGGVLEKWVSSMKERSPDLILVKNEISLVPFLSLEAIASLSQAHKSYFSHHDVDPAVVLSNDALYAKFSLDTLFIAKNHLSAIHNNDIDYAADKAFTIEEAQLISRCARIAAIHNDSGTGALISSLLRLTCFAPNKSKTLPSQSLAISLGHSIQAYPVPTTVQTLDDIIQTIRHSGVKKKLQRNLKPALRALAKRPELALEITSGLKSSKKSTAMIVNYLEAGYAQDNHFEWSTWCKQLRDSDAGSKLTQSLIWLAESAKKEIFTFMYNKQVYRNSAGNELIEPKDCIIRLWHPLHSTIQDRKCWQAYICEQEIKQPFPQVLREIGYILNEQCFSGYWLSLFAFSGAACKEGWFLFDGYIERAFGPWLVRFTVASNLYPGVKGEGVTGGVFVYDRTSSAIPLCNLPPVISSEIMRSIDLLVSISALSTNKIESHFSDKLSDVIDNRRRLLSLTFEKETVAGKICFDKHHIRAGKRAIHLSTAIETNSGEIISMPSQCRSMDKSSFILEYMIKVIRQWIESGTEDV
ncbi:DUF4132 domain-containing protein [Enterobacter cloacae subsp. dissolvens]